MQAIANQIQAELSPLGTADPLIEELQVTALLNPNPSPPSIDVYPAPDFQEAIAMGRGNNAMNFLVRARVLPADHEGQQEFLLSLMDPNAATSVGQAIMSDRTLGNVVERVNVEGPSDYGIFGPAGQELLGCTWLVRVLP